MFVSEEEGKGRPVLMGQEALAGTEVSQEIGSNFSTAFACRMIEDSAWKLGFLFKV